MEYPRKFKSFLIKVDVTPEFTLRERLFGSSAYIDTTGNYKAEKRYYSGIINYSEQTMGKKDLEKLYLWYKSHPKNVKDFMKK